MAKHIYLAYSVISLIFSHSQEEWKLCETLLGKSVLPIGGKSNGHFATKLQQTKDHILIQC